MKTLPVFRQKNVERGRCLGTISSTARGSGASALAPWESVAGEAVLADYLKDVC